MDEEVRVFVFCSVGAILLAVGLWIVTSHFEAKAYENVTGKHVSTLDAMFIELRVQEGTK